MADLKPFEIYEEISGADEIAFGVRSLVLTQLEEMPFFPNYGSSTREHVDAPTTTASAAIKASIAMALEGAIPGVKLSSVSPEFEIVYTYAGEEYVVTS